MTDALLALPADEVLQEALQAAPSQVQRLGELLEQEFQALQRRDLVAFESLQTEKNTELENLSRLAQWCSQMPTVPAAWQALRDALLQRREEHLRNIQLLQRQLEAVRGALQALHGDSAAPTDLYDRSGHLARRYGAWSHHLA